MEHRRKKSRIRKRIQKSNIYVERTPFTPMDENNRQNPDPDAYIPYEEKVQQSLTYQVLEEMFNNHVLHGKDVNSYPEVLLDL